MEAHMVHQNADGKTAVVAIPFKIGAPNPFLDTVISTNSNSGCIIFLLRFDFIFKD